MTKDMDYTLSKEDQALWDEFVSDIIKSEEIEEEDFETLLNESEKYEPEGEVDNQSYNSVSDIEPQRVSKLPKPSIDLNPQLDKRTYERLKKGKIPIERRLDLHGFNQTQAYEILKKFILNCYTDGIRHVLVITGKGQGILRARTREWLLERDMQFFVLKYMTAQQKDGGDGALYVYLRKKRS